MKRRFPRKFGPVIVLALLTASFLSFALTFRPANAYTPNVANVGKTDAVANAGSFSISLTIALVGDTIPVFIETNSNNQTGANPLTPTSAAVSGGFSLRNTISGKCVSSAGFCLGAGQPNVPYNVYYYVGVATTAGAATIAVSLSHNIAASGGQAFDIEYVSSVDTQSVTGECDAVNNQDCGSPITTSSFVTFSGSNIMVAGATSKGAGLNSAGTGYTFVNAAGPPDSIAGEYSTTASSVTSPTNWPINLNGNSGANTGFAEIGAIFSSSFSVTSTSTTTVNTGCLGACSGGSNGTSIFSVTMPNFFVYQTSQNANGSSQIDNFTMKVSSVHITANTATIYVVTCMPTTPTIAASGGNVWSCFNPFSVSITNNTSNFFIHANPQTNICALCFYAMGIFTPTTASRGSGASGAGIGFFETSQTGLNQYKFAVGGATPPTTFFASNIVKPNLFMYIHTTFTVILLTKTLTSTFTTAAITSTTTTTSTSVVTTIDSTFFLQNANYPLIFLVLFLPTGLFLGVSRNIVGAFVGMLIGAVILIVLIPSLSFLFTGLIIGLVALAILTRGGGGDSG